MVAAKRKASKTKTQERDEMGMLSGVDYVFDESGSIDWRKMVKPEFLVPNRDRTKDTNI